MQLTPDGWIASLEPGQYAETIIFDNAGDDVSHYPVGDYTLFYDGEGTIAFDLGSATIVSQVTGSMVVNVPAGQNGIFLEITQTNRSNPIRNIRLIMPGFETTYLTQPFHPLFLATLQNLKVLRFMEWMLTNNSPVQSWSDRPKPSDYTYSLRGVPLEVMVQLANTLNVDPWFNMSHQATNDFVQHFATLVHQQLHSTLRSYVEYSNETWNGMFSQNGYVQNRGLTLQLSPDPVLAESHDTAQRSVEIFQIWEEMFGGTTHFSTCAPGAGGECRNFGELGVLWERFRVRGCTRYSAVF